MTTISFTSADIEIEVRDADASPLIRLFRHEGAAYGLPKEAHRRGRFDPPDGDKALFATLYTGDNIALAAMECRILVANSQDEYFYSIQMAGEYKVVRFQHQKPALFIRVDGNIKNKLGTARFSPNYSPYQLAAKALFERYGDTVDGLSWESFHRGQPGRNYGFWHHRTKVIALNPLQEEANCAELAKDAEWIQLLRDHPSIKSGEPDLTALAKAPAVKPRAAARKTK